MLRRLAFLPLLFSLVAHAQDAPAPGHLDPTRSITQPDLFSATHKPLPEQYIWTHDQPNQSQAEQDAPRWFRVHFQVALPPAEATLYLAGPAAAHAWLNGTPAGNFEQDPLSRLKFEVFSANVAPLLHAGDNVLAIEASRGSELVAKIVPAAQSVFAPAIVISGPDWKATTQAAANSQAAAFDDSSWPAVTAHGGIESNIDFFQWNDDAGLYAWPGYSGTSPFLAHADLSAARVLDTYPGTGSIECVKSLTQRENTASPCNLTVHLDPNRPAGQYIPSVTVDFGREVTGRLEVSSSTDAPATVSIAYGESLGELNNEPYLGEDVLHLAPNGSGTGPKSAFRYARIRFLSGPPTLTFKSIDLEDIYYP
ncbi:MAG: alpha-L-rhamnosidase, partial [Acidobacteriaceae bacterium]